MPATGCSEWVETDDGGRASFLIHHPGGQLLHAAGLTAARKAEDGDGWDVTFARGLLQR
ncbi:hypothetical protein [Brachybacterium sp.]|uniref:hypothetical protein n=1 Tax=Brachybacterium sp. TaxID=1891286 RepID=UPI002ED1C1C7